MATIPDGSEGIAADIGHTTAYTAGDEKGGLRHAPSVSKNSSGSESPKGINEKSDYGMAAPAYDEEEAGHTGKLRVENAEQLVTSVLSVDDDPTLNPWTFRMWFLGKLNARISACTYGI